MRDRWSEREARELVALHSERWGEDLALRTYSSRLIGREPALVLHGGGNTSVKGTRKNVFGDEEDALFVKASGQDLATIEPEDHVAVRLQPLLRLQALDDLDDESLASELLGGRFDARAAQPSIEAPVHAVIPERFVDHTHADAVLVLSNQSDGEALVREALGPDVVIIPYVVPGFRLSKAVKRAREQHPDAVAMVWMQHGLTTWGGTARESYSRMIELVSRVERFIEGRTADRLTPCTETSIAVAKERLKWVAPLVRGRLALATGDPDRPHRRVLLRPLITTDVLELVDSEQGRDLCVSPPLTGDHLIRTKALPLWIDDPCYDDEKRLKRQIESAVAEYREAYESYARRHADRLPPNTPLFDSLPRIVLMPGLGALCAGWDTGSADIARDITAQTLAAKRLVAGMGSEYTGLAEEHLFDMEYRALQIAKLSDAAAPPLTGMVVLVTGAAGAIGSGICSNLLRQGAAVVATDLAGDALDSMVGELSDRHPGQVLGIPVDVTDADSVLAGFDAASAYFGGVDQVIVNAGLAHVSSLDEMDVERFRALTRVNTDGALFVLSAAARHLKRQGTGGDIVLVSTKNVFAPGSRFGAYRATKAAAHQLGRVASQELAEYDVRVNMVAPDAVFSHGGRPSGLWAEVGPDRMKARGLDADGLEDYYRNRNLLKARVTADHVSNAILYFLTRQTPTTGATLPVDGGLPDATPR